MLSKVILTTSFQLTGDLVCLIISLIFGFKKKSNNRKFFLINSIAFLALTVGDIYYNYMFRIQLHDIRQSIIAISTLCMFIFQLSQVYIWYSVIKKQKILILSTYNLPYLFFSMLVIAVLVSYFLMSRNLPFGETFPTAIWFQSFKITLDMLIWFFAIICLARTRSISLAFLTLGCLMLISADLTTRCLFIFEMSKVATVGWIHIIWTIGVIAMAVGFLFCLKDDRFEFCHPNSIQASCSSWMLISSLIAFLIGFIFLFFFNLTHFFSIYSQLWKLPIILMFTMISSVLLGNYFSNSILSPVTHFIRRIDAFNSGEKENEASFLLTGVYEFRKFGEFIDNTFKKLSSQLDREIKLGTQVAHDIRSPLAALEVMIGSLSKIDEAERILLRGSVNHIRDITNNLEKNDTSEKFHEEKSLTQMAVLLGYVVSERRIVLSSQDIQINHNFSVGSYDIFAEIVPSEMKRVLTNIINNACEALPEAKGVININIEQNNDEIIIRVADNGLGISNEVIPSLFTHGFTTKSQGKGLGLYYAKEMLLKWNGDIEISSEKNIGTTVCIKLPTKNPPAWFINHLSIKNNASVVCVDDSSSIWLAWQEKLKHIKSEINLSYCSSKEDLLDKLKKTEQNQRVFLVDYEFSGKDYTGLDLIDIIIAIKNNTDQIFLVTSRSGEEKIQKQCLLKQIYMIPKLFVFEIPLKIINNSTE
jgi:signal transduction histidine kinase